MRSIVVTALLSAGCTWIPAESYSERLDRDADGADGFVDCDDADPGLQSPLSYFTDTDGDGAGDPEARVEACQLEPPPGTSRDGTDCDDGDPRVFPGAVEVCNGVDDDCDGALDDADTDLDASSATLWLPDGDGDAAPGFESLASAVSACLAPAGHAAVGGAFDCDDTDPAVHPGAEELCGDRIDNDCDGAIDDEGVPELQWYPDRDGDRWPDAWEVVVACGDPSGRMMPTTDAPSGTDVPDCRPDDPSAWPGAPDAWYDGVDTDCDGSDDYDQDADGARSAAHGGTDCDDLRADVGPAAVDAPYDGLDADCDGSDDYDVDGDGDRHPSGGGGDCDDTDPAVATGAIDLPYDGVDADCDGSDDHDVDGDGHRAPSGGGGDCDDGDPQVYPGAVEVWYDGIDGDCDGADDHDRDGDGARAVLSGGTDCDDRDPDVRPGAPDLWYDGVDANCDGADDHDQDGDGDPAPSGGGHDCDDLDPTRHRDAVEVWYDGVDSDCDGADDFDRDGDGQAAAPEGPDCDDLDPTVGQGFPDAWYDDLDSDCAGDDDFDRDGDGARHVSGGGADCDDTDRFVFPGAIDLPYDGVDANCDGADDHDQDGDGDPAPSGGGGDCDDLDPERFAGAVDLWYDGIDTNCDGASDFDQDGDGQDAFPEGSDCDDLDPTVGAGFPDAWYDDVDSDCAGNDDFDLDGDGFRHPGGGGSDCDDTDPTVHPGAAETWYDGIDADCAGDSDYDRDLDGTTVRGAPNGTADDCDDLDPDVYRGALEVVDDGVDQDCNGSDAVTCYADADGDGFGVVAVPGPDGVCVGALAPVAGDCDDADRFTWPGAPELCDETDQDCDGSYATGIASFTARDGSRGPVASGATLSSATVASVEVCGGDWDLQISWNPAHGDMSLSHRPGHARPRLVGTRALVTGGGSGRNELVVRGFDVLRDAPSVTLVRLTGNAAQRPSVVLEDLDFPAVRVASLVEVDDIDLVLDRVDIVDSDVGNLGIRVTGGTLLMLGGSIVDTRRVTSYQYFDGVRGVLFTQDAFAQLIGARFDGLVGHAAVFLDSTVDTLQTTWQRNYHVPFVSGSSVGDPYGGAIVLNDSTWTDVDSVFADNTARWWGGAVHAEASDLRLEGTLFEHNGWPMPPEVHALQYSCDYGSDIYVGSGSLEVVGVTFRDTYANDGYATMHVYGDTTVVDSVIEGVVSPGDNWGGVGAYFGGDALDIDGLTVRGMPTGDPACLYLGAQSNVIRGLDIAECPVRCLLASYSDLVQVEDSTFVDCFSTSQGGAISTTNTTATDRLVLKNNLFVGNHGSIGGAVYHNNVLELEGNVFVGNDASSGGAVYAGIGPVTTCGDTFQQNVATDGGGLYQNAGSLTLRGADEGCASPTVFVDNVAGASGGGLFVGGPFSSTLPEVVAGFARFEGNSAASGGGAKVTGNVHGEVVLESNLGATALVRTGQQGDWQLEVDVVSSQLFDDDGAVCALPVGVSSLSCPADAPCVCP